MFSPDLDANFSIENSKSFAKSKRFAAMDIQRGIIMMLMAFSHSREYMQASSYKNLYFDQTTTWLGTRSLDLIQQIFISIVAAGGFFMMMGIGVVFLTYSRMKDGWSLEKTCLYLVKRGLLLILIQLTLLQCFEFMAEKKIYIYIGVLIALGIDMILAAACIYMIQKLNSLFKNNIAAYCLPLLLIVVITVSMQLFANHLQAQHIIPSFWTILFILSGDFHYGVDIAVNFTPLPWFPAVAFGLMIGELIYSYKEKSYNVISALSLLCLLTWFILKMGNLMNWFHFGNYKLAPTHGAISFADFFSTSKYPPSLTYFLWAIGINLFCIMIWHKAKQHDFYFLKCLEPIKIFGQCALFFFIMHWFVYYGISLFLPHYTGDTFNLIGLWLLGLFLLYFMCKSYYAFKLTKPVASLWRMF